MKTSSPFEHLARRSPRSPLRRRPRALQAPQIAVRKSGGSSRRSWRATGHVSVALPLSRHRAAASPRPPDSPTATQDGGSDTQAGPGWARAHVHLPSSHTPHSGNGRRPWLDSSTALLDTHRPSSVSLGTHPLAQSPSPLLLPPPRRVISPRAVVFSGTGCQSRGRVPERDSHASLTPIWSLPSTPFHPLCRPAGLHVSSPWRDGGRRPN